MAVEIKGLAGILPQTTATKTRASEAASSPVSPGSLNPSGVNHIVFTDTAVSLQKLDSILNELPIENHERVGEIREQIAAGLYEINPARVAEKLLAFENLYHGGSAHDRLYASA